MPTADARFDVVFDPDEKADVADAAALAGTTMADFVRAAAVEKARSVVQRETRLTLTVRDFGDFVRTLDSAFSPNPALGRALTLARRRVRCARG